VHPDKGYEIGTIEEAQKFAESRKMKKYDKMNIDYSLDELQKNIKTRKQAELDGDKYFFSGLLCESNHISPRYVSSNGCVRCVFLKLQNNKEHRKVVMKKYYENNKDDYKEYRVKNLEYVLHSSAKRRATSKGIEFTIEVSDIVIPDTCPVFGIPIDKSSANWSNSPSIDRLDNSKGYTKENIRIICTKANKIKNNGSLEEFRSIIRYIENSK
jgi:hypothetical protein